MGLPLPTVYRYLLGRVGASELRRYEVLLSMDPDLRKAADSFAEKPEFERIRDLLSTNSSDILLRGWSSLLRKPHPELPPEIPEAFFYLQLRDHVLADMYELIRKVERHLHKSIRAALTQRFGESEWWRKGVPENIRSECAARREKDAEPAREPYCYTTLIDLKDIYSKEWSILSVALAAETRARKNEFLADMTRLNRIRNSVMHPVRDIPLRDDDFEFVVSFKESLGIKI